mmetsp:Transcript_10987/g.18212  ORF Transcript_10987/g.18212 Transcript_10987/m.18212 type:complete len:312 (+) Transcript_10987:189-1124(+)
MVKGYGSRRNTAGSRILERMSVCRHDRGERWPGLHHGWSPLHFFKLKVAFPHERAEFEKVHLSVPIKINSTEQCVEIAFIQFSSLSRSNKLPQVLLCNEAILRLSVNDIKFLNERRWCDLTRRAGEIDRFGNATGKLIAIASLLFGKNVAMPEKSRCPHQDKAGNEKSSNHTRLDVAIGFLVDRFCGGTALRISLTQRVDCGTVWIFEAMRSHRDTVSSRGRHIVLIIIRQDHVGKHCCIGQFGVDLTFGLYQVGLIVEEKVNILDGGGGCSYFIGKHPSVCNKILASPIFRRVDDSTSIDSSVVDVHGDC